MDLQLNGRASFCHDELRGFDPRQVRNIIYIIQYIIYNLVYYGNILDIYNLVYYGNNLYQIVYYTNNLYNIVYYQEYLSQVRQVIC